MAQRDPFTVDEWYHCYNRGVDKRKIFHSKSDYERFLLLMYAGNGARSTHVSNLKVTNLGALLTSKEVDRGEPLVEIGSYALMPNHFHFVLKETREGGISTFMQKMFTGYTMYFNKKHERTGALFAGPFKSRHVPDDLYLKQLLSYVHLNPVELFEPRWKDGDGDIRAIEKYLRNYHQSSLLDFIGYERPERKLLGSSIFDVYDEIPTMHEILADAQAHYSEVNIKARP